MKLNSEGGIDIVVAAEKPAGVPDENWLPISREDVDIDMILRICDPDLERLKDYSPPNCGETSMIR